MKKTIFLFLLVAIMLLAGCVSLRDQMTRAGFNNAYIDGFEHGTSSGKNAAGNPWYAFQKDTFRFGQDEQYRQGWTDGYDRAKSQYQSMQRSMYW